jgi:hypothetical protein
MRSVGGSEDRKSGGFPIKFPNKREFAMEIGSHMTAHTTSQSYETANPYADSG